ncbi:MAG: hypothetical protein CFE24_06145 [Flavobacterium sp. BFFFF2]|nr:MAG: hypothetical protein CFE24_06145 [Flavobacterium sp. BFFFF2]
MTKENKIQFVQSLLDELATVGYLSSQRSKRDLINFIKDDLNAFIMPLNPLKYDVYINNAKVLVNSNFSDCGCILKVITENLVFALSALYN